MMGMVEEALLVPIVVFLPFQTSGLILASYILIKLAQWYFAPDTGNPFQHDDRQPRKPYERDQKKRDLILKESFAKVKVPNNLDAVIIGSGIGGMAAGAVLAKAGKKVLILEQHDQAGGCCHTFIDKGYEFDVGIHYIGEMFDGALNKTFLDQITDGQLEWNRLDEEYDMVSIGYGKNQRKYPVPAGFKKWIELLKKEFPKEHSAIDEYFGLLKSCGGHSMINGLLKLLPLWLSWLVTKTGLIYKFTGIWSGQFTLSTKDLVESLTDNKDLQTIFCYCWGDYGTPPAKSHFLMQALLNKHFSKGGFYPVGGASEIAYNIIPVIERAGGKVLVRANVKEILITDGRAQGVKVEKGSEEHMIVAPLVISGAGIYNTFQSLLPKQIADKSYFTKIASELKPGTACMNVFLGLNASNEELELKMQNTWAFGTNADAMGIDKYSNLSGAEAMEKEVPLLFISFPSAKDPNWKLHPGRENKATCAIVTLANWEWFKKFETTSLRKRGDEYEELKNAIGHQMIEQATQLFPQIKNNIDYIEIGSPVTNKHYISQPHGEIYGLDHTKERFEPWLSAQLRPRTDIPGLYLTGQDIMTCGFTGALFGGLIAAGQVLGRNVMGDVEGIHKRLYPK